MSEIANFVRTTFGESDAIRDAGLTTPDSIIRYDDIPYGTESDLQILDVYRPKSANGKLLPVIVSVHGGGWVYGTKEIYQFYCMNLAERGFAVVNFSYRLAPECKYPASLEDTNSVFTWVLENANKYGFDTNNIFAVGDSAGAHNLALYTAICTNPDYAKHYSFKSPMGFAPKAIALNCGAYDVTPDNNSDELIPMLMADYLPQGGSEEEVYLIGVANHVTENFVPSFIMTAVDDFLKEQAPILVSKLTEKEIPFTYRMYGTAQNRLSHVFHCNIKLKDSCICNDEECAFFKTFINL